MSIRLRPIAPPVIVAALLSAASSAAVCQTSVPAGDDAVVVTASRLQARLTESIPHTTVITRREITDSQAPDVATLLRRQAGLEVLQNGGLGTQATLSLRGSDPRQVLVLIDGVRAFTATQGTTAIEDIMLDQVERVEIVRGNVSSLYGSAASGGVVQIFTRRRAGPPQADVQAMSGSRGTHRLAASYGGAVGDTRFNVGASQIRSRGFSAIDPAAAPRANSDDDGYRNQSINGSLEQRLAPGHELGLRLFHTQSDVDFDSASAPSTQATVHTAANLLEAIAFQSSNQLTGSWKSTLKLAQGKQFNENLTNGNGLTRFNTRNRQIAWQNDVAVTGEHVISLGLEREEQRVQSTTAYARNARDLNSGFLAYNGRAERHSFQASLRNDRYSDFGGAVTRFLGYGFELMPAWKVLASASTAFIAPTFNQLFFPGFGNPSLVPEHAKSVEAGVQYAEAEQVVRVSAYRTRYRDLIETVQVAPSIFSAQNVSRAQVDGLEASYTGTIAGWEVRSSLTRQDPVNLVTGTGLRRRGKLFGSVAANRSFGPWRVGASLYATDTRPDITITGGRNVELAGYTVADLTARYSFSRDLYLAARLENALNERYEVIHGFKTAPRGVFVTLGWTL